MILRENIHLDFCRIGLFNRTDAWTHPVVTIDSYEIIYMLNGEAHIREGDAEYHLKKGDMLLLHPHVEHGGTLLSHGNTEYYWLHYYTDTPEAFTIPKISTPDPRHTDRVMNELMKYQERGELPLVDVILARWLLEGDRPTERRSKLAHEISEYIRLHAHTSLSVEHVAQKFGYAPDHVSRILRQEFGVNAKTFITDKRLEYIEFLLLSSRATVKEIALQSGFEDENIFVKFYKYHKKMTPSEFRNEYFRVFTTGE